MNMTERNNDKISIHALLAESDWNTTKLDYNPIEFLSTLSLRRATSGTAKGVQGQLRISIHALLAESDGIQSGAQQATAISIHALLAESDASMTVDPLASWHFYPRSPCGERPSNFASLR